MACISELYIAGSKIATIRCQTPLWARNTSFLSPKLLSRAVEVSEVMLSFQSKTGIEILRQEFRSVEIFQSLSKGKIQESIMKNKDMNLLPNN